MNPEDLLFTKEHEWIHVDGDVGVVGISAYAQDQLGDIVFVELPETGDRFGQNDEFGTVESVKTVSDLYCPVAGEVIELNGVLEESPELVNDDPYGKGWMLKIRVASPDELENLLSYREYQELIASQD